MTDPAPLQGVQAALEESFLGMGLDPVAARMAAIGRDRPDVGGDPFDDMVEMFKKAGLSESSARIAAIGRNRTELEAREAAKSTGAPTVSEADRQRVKSALAGMQYSVMRHTGITYAEGVRRADEAARKFLATYAGDQPAVAVEAFLIGVSTEIDALKHSGRQQPTPIDERAKGSW